MEWVVSRREGEREREREKRVKGVRDGAEHRRESEMAWVEK
jgi:hypothetical protein